MSQTQTPSIEAIRRSARQRLIGAGVLVLAGVIVLPLLFDKQPRPVPVDVAIEIPGRNDAPPLVPATVPAAAVAPAEPQAPIVEPPSAPAAASASTPAPVPAPQPQTKPVATPAAPPVNTPAPKPATPSKPESSVRVVVQVGAFADQGRAQEARQRLERAGFKTYTQVAETSEGRRIRVRVGPFDSRAEADRVAARIKQLGFQPSVLTL
jgi:DedD protein